MIVCTVLLVAGGLALVMTSNAAPASALRDVAEFLDAQNSVRIREIGEVTRTDVRPDPSDRWKTMATVGEPDVGHVLISRGGVVTERVFDGGTVYSRSASAEPYLVIHPWRKDDAIWDWADPPDSDGIPTRLTTRGLLTRGLAFHVGPDLGELLSTARQPVRIDSDTIRLQFSRLQILRWLLAGTDAFIDADDALAREPIVIDLTSASGGRLDAMVLTSEESSAGSILLEGQRTRVRVELRFDRWNLPVDIDTPDASQVFDLDEIDEGAVLSAPFRVFAPAVLPSGFRLVAASYYSPEERGLVEPDCGGAELYYADLEEERQAYETGQENGRFLTALTTQVGCVSDDGDDLSGALVFRRGDVQVVIGSTLSEDDTYAAVDALVSFGDTIS